MHRSTQSLGTLLLRRVSILSLIAILGLGSTVVAGAMASLASARTSVVDAAGKAVSDFDLFLAAIQNDLGATSDTLASTSDIDRTLRGVLQRKSAIFEVTLADLQGQVLARRQRVGTTSTQAVLPQPWLQTIKDGSLYISPISSAEYGVPFVTMVTPVRSTSGDVTGALVARIDLTALWNTVVSVQIGESGYAYIVDDQGRLLAYRDLSLVKEQATLSQLLGRTPEQISNTGSIFALNPGLNKQLVISTGKALALTHWYAIVEVPVAQAFQPYVIGSLVLLLAFAIVIVIVWNLVRFIRFQIVSPLLKLREGVENLRQGDLKQRVELPGHEQDEIGLLVSTLNDMVERIDARTQELVRANVLAKESARLKSEFMSTMSHELRTPLNAILGFSGILLEGMGGDIDEDAKHMIERADMNARRLLGLINDVLDIAKIEAGRMEILEKPIAVRSLAQQWKAQTSVLATQKGLALNVEIDPALPESIYGDRERITQIVTNLLSNAVKFTEQGSVKLALNAHEDKWTIQVSDTGIGIPPHALNFIFDEFRQLDGSSRRVYGGTGLGLSIVRNLCRVMDGTVQVSSILGQGSTFTVTLPLKAAVETRPQPVETSQPALLASKG